jgi:hypothetical protein
LYSSCWYIYFCRLFVINCGCPWNQLHSTQQLKTHPGWTTQGKKGWCDQSVVCCCCTFVSLGNPQQPFWILIFWYQFFWESVGGRKNGPSFQLSMSATPTPTTGPATTTTPVTTFSPTCWVTGKAEHA